jgi:hypothetical protein
MHTRAIDMSEKSGVAVPSPVRHRRPRRLPQPHQSLLAIVRRITARYVFRRAGE